MRKKTVNFLDKYKVLIAFSTLISSIYYPLFNLHNEIIKIKNSSMDYNKKKKDILKNTEYRYLSIIKNIEKQNQKIQSDPLDIKIADLTEARRDCSLNFKELKKNPNIIKMCQVILNYNI